MHLRTNDMVLILKGKDRGKQGKVQRVFPKDAKVLVDGVNVVKRHTQARGGVRQAGIIQKEMPVRAANVMLVCPSCQKPSRVGSRRLSDGTGARVCRNCNEVIE
ncbi:MAG: 50S ribosomal protein L24 [Chloroflexi bacterium]|nr:50S ribosomal protein L24 [Chloroflexota bacterium]